MTNNQFIEVKKGPAKEIRPLDRDEAALIAVKLLDEVDVLLNTVPETVKGSSAHRQVLAFVGNDKAVTRLDRSEKLRAELRKRLGRLQAAIKRARNHENVITFHPVIKTEKNTAHRSRKGEYKAHTGDDTSGIKATVEHGDFGEIKEVHLETTVAPASKVEECPGNLLNKEGNFQPEGPTQGRGIVQKKSKRAAESGNKTGN